MLWTGLPDDAHATVLVKLLQRAAVYLLYGFAFAVPVCPVSPDNM